MCRNFAGICTTVVIEAGLDLAPILLVVENIEKGSIFRMIKEAMTTHRSQSSKIDQSWDMPWDNMSKKFDFAKEFTINHSNKNEWNQGTISKLIETPLSGTQMTQQNQTYCYVDRFFLDFLLVF